MANQRFRFRKTPLKGLYSIKRNVTNDNRGHFGRIFCADEFKKTGFVRPISQMNHSFTKQKGIIRGMHFQYPPYTEIKVVSCLEGEIFDVVIDIRKDSPTFLQWYGETLSAKNHNSLYIPEGFAQGFQTLTKNCHVLYYVSTSYSPDFESGLNALDPLISIQWPLDITDMSIKDQNQHMIDSSFEGIDTL